MAPSLPVPAILSRPRNDHRLNSEKQQDGLFRHDGYYECYFGVRDFSHNVYEPNMSSLLYLCGFYLSNTNSTANFMKKPSS